MAFASRSIRDSHPEPTVRPVDLHPADSEDDSLTSIARHAWRMADRCVGRSGWKSLIVRNRTELTDPGDIVADLEEHLRLTTNEGRIRPVATVYHPSIRFRAEQLIRYAGDPQYAGYAATCQRLGPRPGRSRTDSRLPGASPTTVSGRGSARVTCSGRDRVVAMTAAWSDRLSGSLQPSDGAATLSAWLLRARSSSCRGRRARASRRSPGSWSRR